MFLPFDLQSCLHFFTCHPTCTLLVYKNTKLIFLFCCPLTLHALVHLLATVSMCENSCFTCVFLPFYLLLSGSMCAKCYLTFKRDWLNLAAMADDCRVYVRNIRCDVSHEQVFQALQGQVPQPLHIQMCSKKHEGDTSGMISAFLQLLAIA